MKKAFTSVISMLILLLGWQLLAMSIDKPELFPPLPHLLDRLFSVFVSATFFGSVAGTLIRGISGLLLSLAAATLVGICCSRHALLYELFRPILSLMRSVPVISFILLALIFMKPEGIPLLIAFTTMFPLLCENLTNGMKSLRPEWKVLGDTFHIKRINYYTHVIYPQLKPFLFSGLASAIGFGWRAIIMGEVLSQCDFGIGKEMKQAQQFIDVPSLMAWTVIAIIISFTFDKGIHWMEKINYPIRFISQTKILPKYINEKGITLQAVCKSYGIKNILENVSFTFEAGKIYGISAPSGRGKSTLLRLINGTLAPESGSIVVERTHGIPCVFEEPELLPHLTVCNNIKLTLASTHTQNEASQKAKELLQMMEMEELALRYPRELSYGQQRRVSLARALAYPAPVLLMDEPFKGLDAALTERIALRIRRQQYDSRQTIIFVTHTPEELILLAQETIKL